MSASRTHYAYDDGHWGEVVSKIIHVRHELKMRVDLV